MIYLDHNATTPMAPAVLEAMEPHWREHFVNPSSHCLAARPIQRAMAQAREEVAALLDCEPEDLIFTSGGTEALNAAIHSVTVQQPERRHLIIGSTEHEAVRGPVAWLERFQGYEVTRLPVNGEGLMEVAALAEAIRPGRTAAIALMWANNETGVLHPIAEAAALAAAHGIPFITDAVQAAGKMPLSLRQSGVQYAAFSGHKFQGPKGIGALYVQRHRAFQPWMQGGRQENRRRAGTENVLGIVGLGAAARLAKEAEGSGVASPRALRDAFEGEVLRRIPGSRANGSRLRRVDNTSSLRFEGCQAEGLLLLLDQRGVCASAGSACHTGSLEPSHVLTAMGLDFAAARSTLRFSLARSTSAAEMDRALEALVEAVAKFRSLVA